MSPRIRSYIRASALIRQAGAGGAFAAISRKGDRDSGIVLVKVATLDGQAALYSPENSFEGESGYRLTASGPEREIDEKISKRAQFDPDIWVVEIEDKHGRHFLSETIITD